MREQLGGDSTESERGDAGARGEGERKKESKPGWVEEIEERVTECSVCYSGGKKKEKDSERTRVGEADIKG